MYLMYKGCEQTQLSIVILARILLTVTSDSKQTELSIAVLPYVVFTVTNVSKQTFE